MTYAAPITVQVIPPALALGSRSGVTPLTSTRHPVYVTSVRQWERYRLAYEGGQIYVDACLKRYSKRESKRDFDDRKELTYAPGRVTLTINGVRNSMTAKLREVTRNGDPRYEAAMLRDVDLQNDTMNAFIGLRMLPLLLTHGRRLVCVDAPPVPEGATRASDTASPYIWAVSAEDCLSWHIDDATGHLDTVLLRESVDKVEPATGLVNGTEVQYRYMRFQDGVTTVRLYDVNSRPKGETATISGLTRLPVVDVWLEQSLVKDIVGHQQALLNLAATDMSFLYRGNFPLYTQQYDVNTRSIKPRATKRPAGTEDIYDDKSQQVDDDHAIGVGVNLGVGYQKDTERPGFIGPPTDNLRASMEKQKAIDEEISRLSDMALVSMSIKAVEQSGVSKEVDRIARDEAMAYLGQVLETMEREIAAIWHEFLGSKIVPQVAYPTSYKVVSNEERQVEIERLTKLKAASRSETYQREVEARIAELVTAPFVTPERMKEIRVEIEAQEWFDESIDRSTIIDADVTAGVLSKETAAALRGYPEGEGEKVKAASMGEADALSGGPIAHAIEPAQEVPKTPEVALTEEESGPNA